MQLNWLSPLSGYRHALPRQIVLLIDDLHEWTGTEVHLLRLLTRLDPRRIQASIAVVGRADLAAEFGEHGIAVEPLSIRRALAPSGALGVVRIAALLRRRRASLLVTYHTAADLLGPLAGRFAGCPVISCRRDEGFTKKPIHVQLQRRLNWLLAGMISNSHSVVRAVEHKEGYPRARNHVIWNGEDLEQFSPGPSDVRAALGLPPEDCVISCVGLLSPVKDHRTAFAALRALLPSYPNLCLLVAGDGPLRAELARETQDLGTHVRFLGHRRDIAALLRASDIYLQTSLSEGFSNAILQAMACGVPPVVTAVGGNPELVTEDAGVLVPAADPHALASALAPLIVAPDQRRALGRRARARTLAHFSLQGMVDAFTDAFESAIEGRFLSRRSVH